MAVGLFLIFVGVVFMLDNVGVLPGYPWDYLWPLALIAIGFSILARGRSAP